MADITYSRTFSHQDWIDNEDVVQAEGENGFNLRFHALEDELDTIGTVLGTVDAEIKKIQRLKFLQAEAGVRVPAASASPEFDVEIYDRTGMPENVEKVYTVVIFPILGPTHVQHTFLYRTVPGNQVKVTVQFFNPGGAEARFNFRILTLATQS
jgi:hypothetical protein